MRVVRPLKTVPKGSTAAAFHGLASARGLTFYEGLRVVHDGVPFAFRLRERGHCALLFYEEREEQGGLHELAYADLLHCYTLPGAPGLPCPAT